MSTGSSTIIPLFSKNLVMLLMSLLRNSLPKVMLMWCKIFLCLVLIHKLRGALELIPIPTIPSLTTQMAITITAIRVTSVNNTIPTSFTSTTFYSQSSNIAPPFFQKNPGFLGNLLFFQKNPPSLLLFLVSLFYKIPIFHSYIINVYMTTYNTWIPSYKYFLASRMST